jgi:phosphate-selective porin OprO/OprP
VTALLAVALLSIPAQAQDPADALAKVQQLEQKLASLEGAGSAPAAIPAEQTTTDLEKRIKELELKIQQLIDAQKPPEAKLMNAESVERTEEPVALAGFYDSGYLVATSRDGAFKYWLDGRAQIDFADYSGSANRLPTGAEVRRARLGVKATLFTNWLAEMDIDFANNAVEIKDLWGGYSGFENMVIRVGNHKPPFGLDTLTSSKNIMFIERAYVDAWSPDRLIGLSISRWGKQWQASAGVYGETGGSFDDKDTLTGGGAGTSQDYSLFGRVSVAPINKNGNTLHLGFAANLRTPTRQKLATSGADLPDRVNAARIVKFDSRPESHVSRAKFLSTGDMKYVDNFSQLSFELAGTAGRASFQGEYQKTNVNRTATSLPVVDHSFDGYYGQVMVFLTNDRRLYSPSEGEFARVVPKKKGGAVEIGIRYSMLNLDDATTIDPILGGQGKNITAGLTWFINTNHKIMVNFTSVDNNANAKPGKDWAPIPAGISTAQVVIPGDDFKVFAIRYQIAF